MALKESRRKSMPGIYSHLENRRCSSLPLYQQRQEGGSLGGEHRSPKCQLEEQLHFWEPAIHVN